MGSYLSGLTSRPDSFSANAFEQYTIGGEASNKTAQARAQKLRDQTQLMVNNTLDGDNVCNICVFGLMGHGKSRSINLLFTAVQNDVESLSSVVPSGEGSTTRAYSRYELPVSKGGRFPFYLVDTIGVKFADESQPSKPELDSEFSYVRKQLRSLDVQSCPTIGLPKATTDSSTQSQSSFAAELSFRTYHHVIHDVDRCNWTFSSASG